MSNDSLDLGGRCEVCGQTNPETIETHHVVPRRYGGTDAPDNLVDLCGSCHNAIERIYDDEFYNRLGHRPESGAYFTNDQEELGQEVPSTESLDREFPIDPVHILRDEVHPNHAVELAVVSYNVLEDKGFIRSESTEDWKEFQRRNAYSFFEETERAMERCEKFIEANEDKDVYTLLSRVELIHCGYCDRVFLEWEQSDAAKHLQIDHRISDPYLSERDNVSPWGQRAKIEKARLASKEDNSAIRAIRSPNLYPSDSSIEERNDDTVGDLTAEWIPPDKDSDIHAAVMSRYQSEIRNTTIDRGGNDQEMFIAGGGDPV